MPLYLDIHNLEHATPEEVAKAHAADVEVQAKHGVEYMKYWLNERSGKVFCLCHAPSAEAAEQVHREATGIVAERVIEVEPEVLEGFLGSGPVSDAGAALLPNTTSQRDPAMRTVMFTDIVGSTALTQKYGDEASVEMVRIHDNLVRMALSACEGREVKHTGDGIMASFAAAPNAVRCAAMIHREFARYAATGEYPLRVCIGAAAGWPIERLNDLFGSTVQLAARLCAQAKPEQTLISSSVVELCPDLSFESLGEMSFKGFDQPEAVFVSAWSRESDD